MRRLLAVFVATTMLVAPAKAKPPAPRPDILLVVLDDVGFSDLGPFGSEIRTPTLDALAAQGLRYNRFDTKAICSATRAALLTGRNNQTVGMEDLASGRKARDPNDRTASRGEMPTNAETIAQALTRAGYDTSAIGKWHVAPEYDAAPGGTKASWPLQRGFTHYYGFIGGWTDQYRPALIEGNAPIPLPARPGYHLTEDLVDHAITAFDAPGDKPRFVYLALGAAHSPIQAPTRYIDAYRGVYEKGWDALRQERFVRLKAQGVIPRDTVLPPPNPGDASWDSLSPVQKRVFARFMATYAGFITHTDEQLGRLVASLKHSGRFDNTLIVIVSDNGAAPEAGQKGGFRRPYADPMSVEDMDTHLAELGGPTTQALYQRPWAMLGVTPFRRYKLWPYAGGIRTPMIVSWPGHVTRPGSVRNQRVDAIDIAPTLLSAARAAFEPRIDGVAQIPLAGRSMLSTFGSTTTPGRTTQFFELRGNRAIVDGRWEAVAMHRCGSDSSEDHWQLFDGARDFAQVKDVSARYPAQLRRMQKLWWREARRYSDPPITLVSPVMCRFNQFDDDFPGDH